MPDQSPLANTDPFRGCRIAALLFSLLTVAFAAAPAADLARRPRADAGRTPLVLPPPGWEIMAAGPPAGGLPPPPGARFAARIDTRYTPWLPLAARGSGPGPAGGKAR